MKLSARNILDGKIVGIEKGAVNAIVRIDIGDAVVTSSITNAAQEELGLTVGADACAVIKASDVMMGLR